MYTIHKRFHYQLTTVISYEIVTFPLTSRRDGHAAERLGPGT